MDKATKQYIQDLLHWYIKCCHTSWHYDTYHFLTQENITNETQQSFYTKDKYNEPNSMKANNNKYR
jgi:hypothetical protein